MKSPYNLKLDGLDDYDAADIATALPHYREGNLMMLDRKIDHVQIRYSWNF